MKVDFKSSFLKEIKKIKDKQIKNGIADSILNVETAQNLAQVKNIKKLVGY